jgi:hypothetical protein
LDIVIGKLAPLLFHLPFELLPFPLELIVVHKSPFAKCRALRPNASKGAGTLPRIKSFKCQWFAAKTIRPLTQRIVHGPETISGRPGSLHANIGSIPDMQAQNKHQDQPA